MNFKASVLETAKNCRNSTNSCTAAAPKQSLKVAKVYPVAPPGDVHNKNAHLNVNDFNGRTRKNLEPVLFITLTLTLSKEKAKSRECRELGVRGRGHSSSVAVVVPQDSLAAPAASVARCRVYFCCVCKVMELVCIDFAVEQWRRQRGEGGAGCCEYRSTAPGQSFSPFFAFSLPPRALPVDKLFSFCAASRFLMPPTSQTVAAHSLSLSLAFSVSLFPCGAAALATLLLLWCCKFFN